MVVDREIGTMAEASFEYADIATATENRMGGRRIAEERLEDERVSRGKRSATAVVVVVVAHLAASSLVLDFIDGGRRWDATL